MKYAWRMQGGRYKDVDAQVAGEHLEGLIEKYQEHLTGEEILADARHARSPIHSCFDWDDSTAAERHRMRQAKMLANNLHPTKNGKRQRTRAFVLVHHGKHGKRVYMNIRSVMGRPDMRDQVIAASLKQLDKWIGSYGGQTELRFVAKRVEQLRKRIQAELMAMV